MESTDLEYNTADRTNISSQSKHENKKALTSIEQEKVGIQGYETAAST